MARIGRGWQPQGAYERNSVPRGKLEQPPIPAFGALTAGKITVRLQAVQERRAWSRGRFPLQGWGGQQVYRSTAGTDEYDKLQRGMFARRLGPRPAHVLIALPSQQQQTIMMQRVSVRERLLYSRLRHPNQTREADITDPVGASEFDTGRPWGASARVVGPQPPLAILAVPSLALQTIMVRSAAIGGRTSVPRRPARSVLMAPQVLETPTTAPPVEVTLTAVRVRMDELRRGAYKVLFGPVVVGARPPPTQQQLTPVVWAVAVEGRVGLSRRRPHPVLAGPQALQTFVGPTVTLASSRVRTEDRRRQPRSFTVATPPTTTPPTLAQATVGVTLAAVQPRARRQQHPGRGLLGEPVVLQTFGGPQVVLQAVAVRAGTVRRLPHAEVHPPVVVLPLPTLGMETLAATLTARRVRLENQRRLPRSRLSPPILPPPRPEVELLQAVKRPLLTPRVRPHSELGAPQVVLPLPTPEMVNPRVTLADVHVRAEDRRRQPRSTLFPPALPPATPVTVLLQTVKQRAGLDRHRPHQRLSGPTVILPLPTLRVQTVTVTVVAVPVRETTPRRQPRYKLRPPTVVLPLPTLREQTIKATVAPRPRDETARRPAQTLLSPPTVIDRPIVAPSEEQQKLRVAYRAAVGRRTGVTQRQPVSRLAGPVVVAAPAAATLEQQTIRIGLAPARRPTTRSAETNPVRYPPVETTVAVTLTRTRPRPTTHEVVPPAVTAQPPVETVVQTTVVRTRPRPALSLRTPLPPVTAAVFGGPTVTLAPARRPQPRSRLATPTPTQPSIPPLLRSETAVGRAAANPRRNARSLQIVPTVEPGQLQAGRLRTLLASVASRLIRIRHPLTTLRPPATVTSLKDARSPDFTPGDAFNAWDATTAMTNPPNPGDATNGWEAGPATTTWRPTEAGDAWAP